MKTAVGTFLEWFMLQIPKYVAHKVAHEVSLLPKAKDGKDGKKGKDGVSVVESEIALDGHLVFKLSDGRIIDAGPLPETEKQGAVHVAGNAWQIYTADTPPAHPYVNQLWLATNVRTCGQT